MSTTTPRKHQDTTTPVNLYVAFELGEQEWKLAMATSFTESPRLVTIRARNTQRLLHRIKQEQRRTKASTVVSCYEAGRDGFWLHRFLCANEIESRIVDSASIEVNRRARRMKTDPGASSAKYQADIYQCRYGTEAPTDEEIRSGDLPPVSARRDWKECMALLGWTTRVGMRSSEPYSN